MADISVALFIESESHDVDQMNAAIGVHSEKSWRKGDLRGRTGKVYSTDSWLQASKCVVADEIDEIDRAARKTVLSVVSRLQGHEDRFREVAAWGKAGLRVSLVSRLLPPLLIEARALELIGKLGVELEVDVAPQ